MTKNEKTLSILASAALVLLAASNIVNSRSISNLQDQVDACRITINAQATNIFHLENELEKLMEMRVDTTGATKSEPTWDFEYVTKVVAEEARGESLEGQMAVAQTIRERADATGLTPEEVVKEEGQYAVPQEDRVASESVVEACERVLINGASVTAEPIKYFYSTVNGFVSDFHESREFVIEIGNHRFFM